MTITNLIQIATTLFFIFFLKPLIGLLLQVLFPGLVKHSFSFRPLSHSDLFEELNKRGYRYQGTRKEKIWVILSNSYYVFFHKNGRFLDISTSRWKHYYFLTAGEKGPFIMTRTFGGPSVEKHNYLSTRTKVTSPEETESLHKKNVFREFQGDKVEMSGTNEERIKLANRWYNHHIRSELLGYSFFSLVILAIGVTFCLRVWFII
jgi:hypothetical protein